MTQPTNPQKLCKFVENGERCTLPRSDHSYKFCSYHWLIARRERKREEGKYFRKKKREQYNLIRFRYNHDLTEPQLNECEELSETLREEYSSTLDDAFHQFIQDNLQKTRDSLLKPTTDLPIEAIAAKEDTSKLLYDINARRKEAGVTVVTEDLIADVMELQRDIGEWRSPGAFAKMRKNAEDVLKLRKKQGERIHLIHSLFGHMELNRLLFLAYSHNRKFLKKARTWLAAGAFVCERAIHKYSGLPKRKALYLNFCVPLIEATLAFNSNEFDQSENILTSIQERAKAVTDAYGTHPVTETVTFLRAVSQAEIYIQRGNIDSASFFLKEAEQAFKTMQWRSVEAELYVAHAKSGLALARKDQQRQDDLVELHNYISICEHHPFLTNQIHLQELKRLYDKDVPDAPILKSTSIYMDTMCRHLLPILTNE